MREPTYFILVSLMNEPLHGYGIAKRTEALSTGRVKLTAGTLYGALDRLVQEELIVVDRAEVVSGRTRRYYRITEHGQTSAFNEARRMQSAVEAATVTGLLGGWAGAL
jgi:PadR family transcriptional regulator, regulatory protein PadR